MTVMAVSPGGTVISYVLFPYTTVSVSWRQVAAASATFSQFWVTHVAQQELGSMHVFESCSSGVLKAFHRRTPCIEAYFSTNVTPALSQRSAVYKPWSVF